MDPTDTHTDGKSDCPRVKTKPAHPWLRGIAVLLGAAVFSLIAGYASWMLAGLLAGQSVSDAGVRMFARGIPAIFGALVSYCALIVGGFVLASRSFSLPRRLIWGGGGVIATAGFVMLVLLVSFAYG